MFLKNIKFISDAVFSDESINFVSPQNPTLNEIITITLRTAKDNVCSCTLVIKGHSETTMRKSFSKGLFDFWQVKIKLDGRLKYHFVITAFNQQYIYSKQGISTCFDPAFSFVITPDFYVPTWAKGAVMYQIFVDRFCNGDASIDVKTGQYEYLDTKAKKMNWQDPVEPMDIANFYGGDLAGMLSKVDFFVDLGIDALYLTPIFTSPSSHKYDISDYENVDPHFGDNELLVKLISAFHAVGIKIILDGVFNHCGHLHNWAQKDGEYKDYLVWNNDSYAAWHGHENHPKLNYEGSAKLYDKMMQIGQKWLSAPYNADGWRLDVAADLGQSPEFNHKFWTDFRKHVRMANSEAFILAEHYGDPAPWLDGAKWDSVMNYDAFMEPVSWFFTGIQKHSENFEPGMVNNARVFKDSMQYFMARMPRASLESAMNQLSNHDHSRFLTRTNMRTGRLHTHGSNTADEGINQSVMLAAIVMQFTWIGCPTIYYGDEAGLTGWTDPDNRRPYPWGQENQIILNFHKEMIKIYKSNPCLKNGSLEFLEANYDILSYARFNNEQSIICIFNNTTEEKQLALPAWRANIPLNATCKRLMLTTNRTFFTNPQTYALDEGTLFVTAPAQSSIILNFFPI